MQCICKSCSRLLLPDAIINKHLNKAAHTLLAMTHSQYMRLAPFHVLPLYVLLPIRVGRSLVALRLQMRTLTEQLKRKVMHRAHTIHGTLHGLGSWDAL